MDDTRTDRFAAPGTHVQDAGAADGLQRATRGRRLTASVRHPWGARVRPS